MRPTYTFEVAFATDPGAASPTWTDLSDDVQEWSTKRGRQKELDQIEGGSATVKLKNSERQYDPTHDGSPHYPNVLPMRKARIRAVHNAVTYDVFTGYVLSWPQSWEGPNHGFTTISLSDGFLPLSKVDVGEGETWPIEFSGDRINRVLDAAGWPAADRAIDAGYSKIQEVTFPLGSGVTALDHALQVADDELGVFFIDESGNAVFHDRHHRRGSAYLTSQATFSDAHGAGISYRSVVLDTDADRIWNDVQVAVSGGATQRAEDSTSQTTYLRRTLTRQVTLARESEAYDQAAYLLDLHKDPRGRLAGIEVRPREFDDDAWEAVLGLSLADHISVDRHPQQVGDPIEQECWIESIEHRVAPKFHETTYLLSTDAYTEVDWWILGDATYGELGVTTKTPY